MTLPSKSSLGGQEQDFDPQYAQQQMGMGNGMDDQRMNMQQGMGMQNEFAQAMQNGYFQQMQMMKHAENDAADAAAVERINR